MYMIQRERVALHHFQALRSIRPEIFQSVPRYNLLTIAAVVRFEMPPSVGRSTYLRYSCKLSGFATVPLTATVWPLTICLTLISHFLPLIVYGMLSTSKMCFGTWRVEYLCLI